MGSRRFSKGKKVTTEHEPSPISDMGPVQINVPMIIGAYATIFVIAIGLTAVQANAFVKFWTVPPTSKELFPFVLHALLFIQIVVLAVLWIFATYSEFLMWTRYLVVPVIRSEVYAAMYGLAIILGVFFGLVYHILYFSGFITFYLLFNYWAQWLANEHLAASLKETRAKHLSSKKKQILLAMEYYWLKRPQLGRIATMMYLAGISFSLAFAGEVSQDSLTKERFQMSAHAVLILTLFVGDLIIINWWRITRDRQIRKSSGTP